MNPEEFERFVLGALLHDIGKFKQRVQLPEDKSKNHSTIGYEWLRSEYGEGLIAAAARDHHGSEKETWDSNLSLIFYEADNLAASERKKFDPKLDVEQTWQRDLQLASVFSRISLDENSRGTTKYWPLTSLGGWVEPGEASSGETGGSYQNLWDGFTNDFAILKSTGNHLAVDPILHLLEKYTSFIPSMTLKISGADYAESLRKQQDISLFDHAKITAAAAACLFMYIKEKYSSNWDQTILKREITEGWEKDSTVPPFLLIGGDISGVQNFIFTISSKGALKSLKGRSFFLELLTEHVADLLVSGLNLSRCNILFTGGGHFYVLAPNTQQATGCITRIRDAINRYLLESFDGALLQFIEWVAASKNNFRDASGIWEELSEKLSQAKKRKWEDHFDLLFAPPAMPHPECLTESCEVCGREDMRLVPGDLKMCSKCREQFDFGAALQKACRKRNVSEDSCVAIAVWDEMPPDIEGLLAIGEDGMRKYYQPVLLEAGHDRYDGKARLYRINDWEIQHFIRKGDRPMLSGVFHPRHFEDLETLLEEGFGWNLAAVLRMDVDHLGQIFARGLPREDRTLSRMASLSRQFSLFFKYHLNGILDLGQKGGYESLSRSDVASRRKLQPAQERRLSIVYSGGDDLFLIGHWLDILEAAFDINEGFRLFTGNAGITLSGGYALGDSHHPVYRFAADAGEAEKMAKGSGRNAFCFFLNQPFQWKDACEIRDVVQKEILPLFTPGDSCLKLPKGSFSAGFLYRLLALVREFKKEQAWVLPKVAYAAGRNGPQAEWLNKNRAAAEAWVQLKQRFFMIPEKNHLKKLERAILWTLMMMRKGGEG